MKIMMQMGSLYFRFFLARLRFLSLKVLLLEKSFKILNYVLKDADCVVVRFEKETLKIEIAVSNISVNS